MLKNLVALVTGGSQCLGKGTAKMFLENGVKVVLCDVADSNGAEVAKSLGSDVLFVPTNIANEADVRNALEITQKNFGRLDVLVNCNNHLVLEKFIAGDRKIKYKTENFINSLTVNTIAAFNLIRLAVPLMNVNTPDANQQRGVIINTVHVTAFDGHEGEVANSASNAAIVGMTLPIARELSKVGIRVVNIAPAVMETEFYQQMPQSQKEFHTSMNTFPLRPGKPTEFAHMVKTIVENPMLNAQTIQLDCGYRAI